MIPLNWQKTEQMSSLCQFICHTPLGALLIHQNNGLLARWQWLTSASATAYSNHRALQQWLDCYWKNPSTPLTLPLYHQGSAFQQRVWQTLRTIPVGQTRTYGELAVQLDTSPRALANACRANPFPLLIPCHRVIGKHKLGGYAGQTTGLLVTIKCLLLQHEGALSR